MKMKMIAVVFGCCLLPVTARAAEWSANLAATSNYVSRGFEQSWGKPVVQAGLDVSGDSGWYVGTWVSGVSPRFIESAHAEWDVYAGHAKRQGNWGYRAGLYYYAYPGAKVSATGTRFDYGELIVAGQWKVVEVSYATTITRDYFGNNSDVLGVGEGRHSRGSGYLSVDAGWDMGDQWRLDLHGGRQRVKNFSDYNWTDAKVALTRHFSAADVSLSYAKAWNSKGVYDNYTTGIVDADGRLHVDNPIAGAWALTIKRSFEL